MGVDSVGRALHGLARATVHTHDEVGVVEKLWSLRGSVREGHILALFGEAGYQADLLRGGIHFGYWRWQYAVHRVPLVTIPQGKIGYVYARDGESLAPTQTLGQVVDCNDFQDARRFVFGCATSTDDDATRERVVGQRGRQRAILREGCVRDQPGGVRRDCTAQDVRTVAF